MFVVLAAVLLLSVGGQEITPHDITDYEDCFFVMEDEYGIRTEYNLSWFHLKDEAFEVIDSESEDWEYVFNVCGAIPKKVYKDTTIVPNTCYNMKGPCLEVSEDDPSECLEYFNTSGHTPLALQIGMNENTACYWLGAEISDNAKDNYNVSFVEPDDAARGIVFEYTTGTWCDAADMDRKLRVEFICPDTNRYTFDPDDEYKIEEEVDERPTCVYTIVYESPLACPDACISSIGKDQGDVAKGMYSVCNSHGICATDPNAKRSHCLCDDGWTGEMCTEEEDDTKKVTESHSGLVTAIILCIILLAIVVALSAFLCHRIRLKEQEQQGQLSTGFFSPMLNEEEDKVMQVNDGAGISMDQTGPLATEDPDEVPGAGDDDDQ